MTESSIQDELKHVLLEHIRINPYQPRGDFCSEELEGLADSIRAVGILHPPLVRPLVNSHLYELIAGERRFRAAELANLTSIPVYVRHTDYAISAQAALIENVQRVDLNPLEISKALKRLMLEFGLTQDELGRQIGKKRSTIANYLRLLSLPKTIQESLLNQNITMGHAKAILSLECSKEQQALHDRIIRESLNVRKAEDIARCLLQKEKKETAQISRGDEHLEDLKRKMEEKLGTSVSIQGAGTKGCISIDYYSLDDLDRLLDILGIAYD